MLYNISVGDAITALIAIGGLIGLIAGVVRPVLKLKTKVENNEKRITEIETSNKLIIGGLYALLSKDDKKIDAKKEEFESYLINGK